MKIRIDAVLTVIAILMLQSCSQGEEARKLADTDGQLSAPITYEDLMLIISTKDGVAVIAFGEEIEKGVNYRYRYLSRGEMKESSGKGKVLEKVKRIPGGSPTQILIADDGSELFIRAGSISIEWSYCLKGKGWIYYTPEKVSVQIANDKEFDRIDLKRFIPLTNLGK